MIRKLLILPVLFLPLAAFAQEEEDPEFMNEATESVAYSIEDRVPCPDSLVKLVRFEAKIAKALKAVKKANREMFKASGVEVIDLVALRDELTAYKLDCRDSLENPDDEDDEDESEDPEPTPEP
jgi:hypothetical protein